MSSRVGAPGTRTLSSTGGHFTSKSSSRTAGLSDPQPGCRSGSWSLSGRSPRRSQRQQPQLHAGLVVNAPRPQAPRRGPWSAPTGARDGREAAQLTPREAEVLRLLASGAGNKQIAWELGVSEHTVKFHTSAIYAKLGVANRTEALRRGVELGLLSL